MSKIAKEKLCPYCGKYIAELTREHIVAKGLFVPPYPDNLLTVKVCGACNQEKGRNDDYLRDFLILHPEVARNATARTLKETTLIQAIASEEHGNTSKVAQALATRSRPIKLYTSHGVLAGNVVVVPIEAERRNAVLQAMVKGLYFREFRRILPNSSLVSVVEITPQKTEVVWESFLQQGTRGRRLGDVFSYQCLPKDTDVTFWLLLFYEGVLFEAVTCLPDRWKKESVHV